MWPPLSPVVEQSQKLFFSSSFLAWAGPQRLRPCNFKPGLRSSCDAGQTEFGGGARSPGPPDAHPLPPRDGRHKCRLCREVASCQTAQQLAVLAPSASRESPGTLWSWNFCSPPAFQPPPELFPAGPVASKFFLVFVFFIFSQPTKTTSC